MSIFTSNKCCTEFSGLVNVIQSSFFAPAGESLVLSLAVIHIHQVLLTYYRGALQRRDAIYVHRRTNVRELTLAAGRALMVSRVFTVALSFVRIIPYESTPSAGGTYQTRRSSHLPIYFQSVERPPAPSESTTLGAAPRRPKSIPEEPSTAKSAWPSVSRNLPVLSENKVEIAP